MKFETVVDSINFAWDQVSWEKEEREGEFVALTWLLQPLLQMLGMFLNGLIIRNQKLSRNTTRR